MVEVVILENLGVARELRQKVARQDRACNELPACTWINPDHYESQVSLGVIHDQMHDWDKSLQHCQATTA